MIVTDEPNTPMDVEASLKNLQNEEGNPDFRSGFVAVVGQPNVGKSTLMNRLVGQKVAIVSPKPQTTRRQIRGLLTTAQGQIIFVDTPGVHDPHSKLGEFMNTQALSAIPDADVVLFMVQAGTVPDELDREIAARVQQFNGPKVLVINKIDVVEQAVANARYAAYEALGEWNRILLISAIEGHGVEAVAETLLELLPPGPLYFPADQVTDQTEQVLVSEIVREVALRHLQQEVPHAVNVEVIEWSKRKNGLVYIEALITVEKDSQKGIVIGSKGSMLRRISTEARQAVEQELNRRVYLELRVKVRDAWRDSDTWLQRFGYKGE